MDAISNLLDRAELLAERGQFKMLASCLDEIDRRAETEPLEQDQLLRYQRIDKLHSLADSGAAVEPTCHKCGGSGQYFNNAGPNGHCFACVGKGYQTARDVVREKNYYARRENRQVSAYQPDF